MVPSFNFSETDECDVSEFLNTSFTEDNPLDEPKPAEVLSTCLVDNFGPPLRDHEIGPEDGRFRVKMSVIKNQFVGQRLTREHLTWMVRANTRRELYANFWQLTEPYVRRAVEFPTVQEPVWAEKEMPDQSDLPIYLTVRDCSGKRSFKMDQIEDEKWLKWTVQNNLQLIVFLHSSNVQSRAAWELVVEKLLKPLEDSTYVPKTPALFGEELKLDLMTKRLKRFHQDKLFGKVEDAFEQWARWILTNPFKRHSNLSYSMPPGDLLKNFVVIKQNKEGEEKPEASRKRPPRKKYVSGPAKREHTTDGFGFEDEVKILRQTVTQIKDLVEMLDYRVGLLEEKCQGFKQEVQGNGHPPKKARMKEGSDSENDDDDGEEGNEPDQEPMVDEADEDGEDSDWNPDPLLFNDMLEVKQESIADSE